MRVYKSKYYVLKSRSGGLVIVTGHKAANEKPYVVSEFNPVRVVGNPSFELNDGHIQGYRPVTTSVKTAMEFLDDNKFSFISIIN